MRSTSKPTVEWTGSSCQVPVNVGVAVMLIVYFLRSVRYYLSAQLI